MHKMAADVQAAVAVPLLHIADPTAEAIKKQGIHTIALLGTKFTMEQDFYRGRLSDTFHLNVIIPTDSERQIVHDIIYNELCVGVIKKDSKKQYTTIISQLEQRGAQGVILGCTEIGLLVKQHDVTIPIFDTALIHAQAAVDYALSA
jgi:aspartate racemase